MPLSDECFVIRFGLGEIPHLRKSLEKAAALGQGYELSFFGCDGLNVEEIARVGQAPNGRMRVSTVGRLRGGGFMPYIEVPPPCHLGLCWEAMPSDEELNRLMGLFDEPIDNPHPV